METTMFKILGILVLIQIVSPLQLSSALYKEVFSYHNETDFKANFAYQVVYKIYNAFNQWFFTIIFCEFTYFENRVLKYTETMGYGYPVLLLNSCPGADNAKVKPRLNIHGQTTYVVSSDELSLDVNEQVIQALIKTGVFQPRSTVIFVINVPVEVDSYFYFDMEQHFQLLCSRRITNSVLVLWSDQLRVYTYNRYFNRVIEITEVKDIDRVLTRQYHNLYGHVLRLSVFRKAFLTDETGPVKCDSRIAKTVMTFLNATCLPLAPRDGSTVGDLLDNGTATGVTGDLKDSYTDLELNSRILKNSYYGYIDTTYPLAQDELCFLVKKSGRQSAFTTTLKLISTEILMIFMFNVIFFISVALSTRKAEAQILKLKEVQTTSSTMMDLVKCFLRQTVDIKFLGPVFRAIVLLIIVYSLIVDCAIDGIITSAITYPRYKPDINTDSQLVKHTNLTFAIHNQLMKIFNKSLSDEYNTLMRNRIEVVTDKKIKEVIDKRLFQYAVLLRKADLMIITSNPTNVKNGRPLYHIVENCPLPCSVVYGLQYGSPYLPRINYILHHLNQAGILQHWRETEDYTLHKNLGKNLYATKVLKSLDFNNLQEVFFVWMIGIVSCSIIFLFETFWHKLNNFKSIFNHFKSIF